ncbi:MAG: sigma-70 family RNA polymerase sigma factor [Myxococcota bacterium]
MTFGAGFTRRSSSKASSRDLNDATINAARRGDPAAQRAIVERHQHAVFALVSRMAGADAADDLAQETFLRVFRALPEFTPHGQARLSTWILTIGTRVAIDHLRRVKPFQADVVTLPSSDASPERAAAAKGLGQRIAAAVEALPATYRAAFILRGYHELSLQEIAQALDCDVNTVKSRLGRARAMLRSRLRGERDDART